MRYSGRVILVCYVLRVDTFLVLSTEEHEWATVMLKKNPLLIESSGPVSVNEGSLSVLSILIKKS